MQKDRIFMELKSREFQFVANGVKYKLPHLNQMKGAVLEARERVSHGEMTQVGLIYYMFEASGNTKWAKDCGKLTFRQLKEIFDKWFEWSGVSFLKVMAALEIIGDYPDAVEADLLTKMHMTLPDLIGMPFRTIINVVDFLRKDMSSYLCAELQEFDYKWSRELEILSQISENFVTANSKSDKPHHSPRPYDNKPKYRETVKLTEKEQAKIHSMLTPMNFDKEGK